MLFRTLVAVTLLLAGCAPTPTAFAPTADAPATTDRAAAVQASVTRAVAPLLEQHGIAGMAVAVTVDGQRYFTNLGVASRDTGDAVDSDTIFEIGSLSKTFTATLATYAQADRALSLTDHPSRFLPELRGTPVDAATLANLGTYTAGGLPLQFPDGVTDRTVLDYYRSWVPDAPPGTQRRYSNPSVGLLGLATAAALRTDFRTAIEQRLLPALHLPNSFVSVPADRMPRYAQGYDRSDRPVRVNPGPLDTEAYGIKSTATDMIGFVEANIDPSRLSPPFDAAVAATHVGSFAAGGLIQGLGWEQYPYPTTLDDLLAGNSPTTISEATPATPVAAGPEPALFNKTGSTDGFGAYAAFVPQRRIGIVMLANRNFPIAARVTAAHAVLTDLVEAQ